MTTSCRFRSGKYFSFIFHPPHLTFPTDLSHIFPAHPRDGSIHATDEVFNAVSHLAAFMVSLLGTVLLITGSSSQGEPWKIVSRASRMTHDIVSAIYYIQYFLTDSTHSHTPCASLLFLFVCIILYALLLAHFSHTLHLLADPRHR